MRSRRNSSQQLPLQARIVPHQRHFLACLRIGDNVLGVRLHASTVLQKPSPTLSCMIVLGVDHIRGERHTLDPVQTKAGEIPD